MYFYPPLEENAQKDAAADVISAQGGSALGGKWANPKPCVAWRITRLGRVYIGAMGLPVGFPLFRRVKEKEFKNYEFHELLRKIDNNKI